MEKLYKILEEGKSCHGGKMAWSLPTKKGRKWVPGEWMEVDGDLDICKWGLHVTTEPYKWYTWTCTCYEAEAEGIAVWEDDKEDDKCVARRVRLTKEIPHPDWWKAAHHFVEEELPAIPWMKPDGQPDPSWKLFGTRAAAWAAAGDAAGAAARDAAWAAAWAAAGAAARDAARAAARDAARDAARAAAWDAAWSAAWSAARAAAWAAALYARMLVCADLPVDEKHRQHATDRMNVWKKGYGLFCDVDGVLYVYEKL